MSSTRENSCLGTSFLGGNTKDAFARLGSSASKSQEEDPSWLMADHALKRVEAVPPSPSLWDMHRPSANYPPQENTLSWKIKSCDSLARGGHGRN